jgi:tetratricopeptide (TPR) repeat protein
MNSLKYLKVLLATSVFIGLFLFPMLSPIQAYDVHLELEDSTSTFSFESHYRFDTKLLTDSPSSKIMIKLSDLNLLKNQNYPDTLIFKNSGSIVEIRFMKIDENQILLIIDLLDNLNYKFVRNNYKFSIIIQDSYLKNPLEKDYFYGLYYQRLNKPDMALEHYRKVLSRDDTHPEAHFAVGKIHFNLKQYQTAKKYFEKAYQCGKDQNEIYFYLGEVYKHLGQENIAKSYYNIYQKSIKKESQQKNPPKVKESVNSLRIKLV